MANQTNSSAEEKSIFIQKNSAAVRIWHWLTFLFVIALAVTVLLQSTIINQRKNIPLVQTVLKDSYRIYSIERRKKSSPNKESPSITQTTRR